MEKKHNDLFAFFRAVAVIISLLFGYIFNAWVLSIFIIICFEILIYYYNKKVKK